MAWMNTNLWGKCLLAVCGPDRSGNPFCGFGIFEIGLQKAAKRLERIAGIVRPNLRQAQDCCLNQVTAGQVFQD